MQDLGKEGEARKESEEQGPSDEEVENIALRIRALRHQHLRAKAASLAAVFVVMGATLFLVPSEWWSADSRDHSYLGRSTHGRGGFYAIPLFLGGLAGFLVYAKLAPNKDPSDIEYE